MKRQSTIECPFLLCSSSPQTGKAQYLSQLQMRFFKKATLPDANSLFTSLYWATAGNPITCTIQSLLLTLAIVGWQTICVASTPYCQHHLMHSWRSSIKRAPILTIDILWKIAWSGTSVTAMMNERIKN